MPNSTGHLLDLLKVEQGLYNNILEMAKEKQLIIIEGKTKELELMTKREQEMISKLLGVEKKRSLVVDKLVKELGIGTVHNISEIMEYIDKETAKEFMEIKLTLSESVKKLTNENEVNSRLISQSLEIIDFNMNLLSSINNENVNYGSNADEKDVKRKSNLFDVRV